MIFYRLSMNVTEGGMHLLTRVEAMLSYVYNQNELDSDDSSNNEEIISEEEYNHDELGSDDSLNNEEIRRERIENELKDVFEIMKVFSTRIYRCSELKRVWENNPRPESPSEYYIYIFNGGNDLYLKRGREIKLTMEVYDNVLEVRNNFADEEYHIFNRVGRAPVKCASRGASSC